MEFVIILAILFVVVFVVTGPLRRVEGRRDEPPPADGVPGSGPLELERESRLAELEALREAKYREIRDAELDHATGKLSRADYDAVDGRLRAEALEILHEIDRLAPSGEPAGPSSDE